MVVNRYVNLDERDHKNWLVDDQAAWLTNQLDIRITMRKIQHRLRYTATIFHHRNNWKCCIQAMLCRGQLLFPAHKKRRHGGSGEGRRVRHNQCLAIWHWQPSPLDLLLHKEGHSPFSSAASGMPHPRVLFRGGSFGNGEKGQSHFFLYLSIW